MLLLVGAARVVVAVVFFTAALAKLSNRAGTRRMLEDFGVPSRLSPLVSFLLPATEAAVAVCILLPRTSWLAAVAALLLLAGFTAAIAVSLIQGRAPECHCFGAFRSRPVSARSMARNVLLAVPPAFLVAAGAIDGTGLRLRTLTGTEVVLAGLVVFLATAVVVLAFAVRHLFHRHRELAESIALLESHALHDRRAPKRSAPEPPRGLTLGVIAPDAMLLTPSGKVESLGVIRRGRAAILVFVSHGCAPCRDLLPRLAGWRRKLEGSHQLLVIARGKQTASAELAAAYPQLDVHCSDGDEVGVLFRAEWSPAAVAIGADGRIASETRFGPDAIEALLASASEGTAMPGSSEAGLGDRAPNFAVVDIDGRDVTNHSLSGSETLMLYWSTACGFCSAMEAEMSGWRASAVGAPRLIMLIPQGQELADNFGASHVIADGALARAFGLSGTPSALLIRADGTIGSKVCLGTEEVRSLFGITRQSANVIGTRS